MSLNKLHQAVLIFSILVTTLIFGAWQLVQTEMFSSWISERTNYRLASEFGIDISFQSIEINMFPPATIFKKVAASKQFENENIDLSVEVDELGVYLGLWDLLSNKISIEKVLFAHGSINVVAPVFFKNTDTHSKLDSDLLKKIKISEVFSFIQGNIVSKFPVHFDGIMLDQVELLINDDRVWINKALTQFDDDYISFDISIEQLRYQMLTIDSVDLSASLYRDNIDIENASIINRMKHYNYKGKLIEQDELLFDGTLHYVGDASDIIQYGAEPNSEVSTISGHFEVDAELEGPILNPQVKLELIGYDVQSAYGNAKKLELGANYKHGIVSLGKLRIKQRGGLVTLVRPQALYDVSNRKIINNQFSFNLQRLRTTDAFNYLKDSLAPIKGRITGIIDVKYENDDVIFAIKNGSYIEKFSLQFSQNQVPVLQNPKISISNTTVILKPDHAVLIDANLGFASSSITAKGKISPDYISISAVSSDFSFRDFGAISGASIEGDGILNFNVDGPFRDVRFYFDAKMKNVQILDLDLGQLDGKLRLDLKDLKLYFNEMKGRKGTSLYTVNGKMQFQDEQKYELYASFPYATYRDSVRIYKKHLPVGSMPKGLAFSYSGDYKILGSLSSETPHVSGNIKAKNLTWFNETIDKLDLSFLFENEALDISNFSFIKQSGEVLGQLTYDLRKKHIAYSARLDNLRLNDIAMYRLFNFGYDGRLSGSFKGDGNIHSLITQSKLKVTKGNIFNRAMRDSSLVVYTDKNDVFINGALIGNILSLDSYVNLDMSKQSKKSYLNASINSTDVKILTGFISEHNSLDSSIKGRISANLESTFSLDDWSDLNLLFQFDEFAFRRENIKLRMNPIKRNVIVKNGEIKHWDVLLKGPQGNIYSRAAGNLDRDFKIESGFVVDSSIMEMFLPVIQKSTGLFSGRWLLMSKKEKIISHLETTGENIYLKLKVLPDSFEKVDFAIAIENDEFFLQKLNGRFGQGSISADGNISLKLPYPKIDLAFSIDQSRLTFFNNSSVVVSGDVKLQGDRVPYNVRGDIALLYGELLDEFSEYDFGDDNSVDNKYIPKAIDVQHINFFNYNLGVRTFTPILMRNQMTDIQFSGAVVVGGTYQAPEIKGQMSTIVGESRFMFKGHEFELQDGILVLDNDIINKVPSISVSATSRIQNYDVKVDVSGKIDDFDVKLSSEPSLSPQDILSLLTLGITSDISKKLDDNDRESITSLGLGSLIVDQFKLNRGLDSSLGLKLSVLPAFGQSDESLLHGRKSGSSASTKIKSATKVKVQTKIKDHVDLSFSSTLGGSMKQKQEINLNYNLDPNSSLQLIYETEQSSSETDESINSMGIDYIFRKTFK